MSESTLERNLMNANSVASVLAKADICGYTRESIQLGEKPYKCKQCGKCFSEEGSLRSRERFHTGEKPYECKQCSTYFIHEANPRAHEKGHLRPSQSNKTGHLRYRLHVRKTPLKASPWRVPQNVTERIRRKGNSSTTSILNSAANSIKDTMSTPTSASAFHVEKHSCWICQEELSSEALLLEHYDKHMRCV